MLEMEYLSLEDNDDYAVLLITQTPVVSNGSNLVNDMNDEDDGELLGIDEKQKLVIDDGFGMTQVGNQANYYDISDGKKPTD